MHKRVNWRSSDKLYRHHYYPKMLEKSKPVIRNYPKVILYFGLVHKGDLLIHYIGATATLKCQTRVNLRSEITLNYFCAKESELGIF